MKTKRFIITLICLVQSVIFSALYSQVYYVKVNGTGDGSSWEKAMSGDDFTDKCGSVPDGTTFYLAEGDYEPMKVYGYSAFYLNSDIKIIGGFPADAKTGSKREKGKYSTIDASDLGVKSYLFRRMSYDEPLNIHIEGLKMMNVLNAIEAHEGSKVKVLDCVFDNAPIVLNKVDSFSITDSKITNISDVSEIEYPFSVDSAAFISFKNVDFSDISSYLFKPSTPYIKKLSMEDVSLNKVGGMLFDGKLGEGTLSNVKASGAALRVQDISSELILGNTKLSHIELVIGNYFRLSDSEILGSGVDLGSVKTARIENTLIDNQGKGTCISSLTSNVTVSNSTLKNGVVGYSYKIKSHTIQNCYIIGNSKYGINTTSDYHTPCTSLELIENHIGIDPSGKVDANGNGVYVNANTFIAKDNIISGNTGYGVTVATNETSIFERNFVGTDELYRDLGNGGCGIDISGMSTLGGRTIAPESIKDANIIGFNGGDGIIVKPAKPALSAKVSNNYIGVTKEGDPIPNKGYGISIVSGYYNLPVSINNNHIGYNEKGDVSEGIGSYISQNVFLGNNNAKAIENNTGYKTLEDNLPIIKEVRKVGDSVYVEVQVKDHFDVDVELYETDLVSQSAKKYLGKISVKYSDGGSCKFSVPVSKLEKGFNNYFVATAYYTSYNFTTEFSSLYRFTKPLDAGDYYVKEKSVGDSTGSSWENAMSAKQFATSIPYAEDGATFHLAAGNYTPLLTYGYGNYYVNSSIRVIGGYPADAKSGAKSDPQENITMMDGGSMPIKTYLFNSYGKALKIELDGIYMRNVMSAIEGGSGSVVIAKNCEFSNAPIVLSNKADSLSLINCAIKDITESSESPTPIVLDSLSSLIISSTTINNIYGQLCTYVMPSNINAIEMDNVNMSIDTFFNMGHFHHASVKNSIFISRGITAYTDKSITFDGVKILSTNNSYAAAGIYVDINGSVRKSEDVSLFLKDITIEGYNSGVESHVPHVYLDNVNVNGKQTAYGLYALKSSDVIISNSNISNARRGIEVAGENLKIENSVISGNTEYGVKTRLTLKKVELYNNIIGLTKDETDVLANEVGVNINADTFIATGNVISGNNSSGIQISADITVPSTQNIIEKNYIGVKRDGSSSPNGRYGIEVLAANRKDFLKISNNYFGGNTEGDILVNNTPCIISQNIFYGNKELAIKSIIEKPVITSVSFSDNGYVVKGEIVNGLDKIKDGVTVELFETNKEPQSALKYLMSTSDIVDGKFSIEISDLSVDTSCLAAVVIFNAESAAKTDKYSSELSDPYCLCELASEVITDTVFYGAYSEIFGEKYSPYITGDFHDTIIYMEDGCQKTRIESLTVVPLDLTLGNYYVKEKGTGDGSSWENAMSARQFTAICGSVPNGTTFHLAEGNYEPMKVYGYSGFYLNSDIKIIGGYPADAKTGAIREKGKYSTIDASDLGAKSYLFRRMNYADTLNIQLEGLAMRNVMNAIEGDPGSVITVEDCMFDNAPLVFNKSSQVEISNSIIQNITEVSEFNSSIEADSVASLSIRDSKIQGINGNVFTWTSVVDSLTMENVEVNANSMLIASIGSGLFNKVTSNTSLHSDNLVKGLSISESSLPGLNLKGGNLIKIASSVIEGEGVNVNSDSVVVDNSKIINKGTEACLYTTDSRVFVNRSILSGGTYGVYYKGGSVDVENSYIYSNTEAGIEFGMGNANSTSNNHLSLKNNYIGLNEQGEVAGNKIGVFVSADKFVAIDNVISGNDSIGIEFRDVNEAVIENNFIGTDRNYRDLGNGDCGINLRMTKGQGTGSVKLSPSSFDKANVIGFNGGDGVIVSTSTQSDQSYISHNYIGVAPDGTKIPNKGYGVRIQGGYYSSLPAFMVENHLGYNKAGDVSEEYPFKISQNIFHGNDSKAIDRTYSAFNNSFDPVITSVKVDGDNYIVSGKTAEHAIVDIELFGTNSTPQSAMVYLGKISLNTSDLGDFSFTVPMEKMSKDSLTCFVATVWSESYRFTTELSAPYCLCGLTPEIVEEVVPFGQPSQYFGDKYDSFFIGESRETVTTTEEGCAKVRIESFSVAPLEIKDYFVKENGTGDGSSWENAMSGEAFAAYLPYAPDSSTFRFAAGTYQPSLDINLQKTENAVSRFFLVRNDVSIVGGYPTDAKDGDESDPENNPTVFSGNIPGNAEEGTTDDSTTYLFYIDMGVNEVRFEGVEIAHARNGVCADLAPQSNIVVRNSEMNNCDAAVKVTLMLSSLELDNVKFDSNVNAVSSGSIKNTIVKNSTFVNHSGTPLRVLSSGKLTISNSIFEGNQTLPIIAGSTSDVSITSSTISNTLSQGQDEPIIQSSIVKMVNSTLLDNEQGKDWIKADSVVMYHNTLLGISGLVGNIFVNSSPVSTFNANILGFDSLPSTTTELLDNNVVGLTKGELPQTADSRLLSKDQVDLLFYKENDKFLLTNRGGLTPVVALRTDTLENGNSIRVNNTGIETDQRGEERPELTCMGSYEYLQPVVITLTDSLCFGETIYQNNGFDIVLEDSVSGVFEFDRVVATERLDTSYYLTLKVKPRLKLTNVLVTPSTCISEPNGQLTFDVEGWEESISYMSYVGEVADTLSPLSVVNAVASFRVDGVKDKTFTVHVENKCGIKNETIIVLDTIPSYSISISDISTTDLRCSYSMDGLIEVVISGGHDSSEFSMRDSFTIARENLPSNPDTITIDNLGPGIYNFSYHSTVEGCPDEVVASHQIKAPEPIIFKNSIANATCYGLASGELDIVPLRNGDSIKFVDENMSINYASAVLDNKRTDYSGKFGDIDSIGFSLVSLDSSVNMYGKTQDQFFNDALKDAVILTYPMDSMSQHNSTYTEFKYPQSWLGYTAMYPGVYKIEVRDVKGCYFEQNFEIKNPENPLAVTMDHAIDKCDADKRRVELRATGGWAPYQFIVTKSKDWGNQEDNDNKDLTGNQGGVTVGQDFEPDTSLVIDGDTYIYRSDILPLDTINIMVMDKKGCVDTVAKNMIVDANIKVIGEEISDKCAQPKDHSIKVNLGAEYANKPHSYKIRCAQKDSFLVITEFKTDEEGNDIISGLPSGKVGVFAYADGCSGYSTVEIIGDTSLSFIPYVAMKLDSVGSCPDAATGELELKVYGSYPPYHMYLDNISDASLLTSIDMYDTVSNGYAQIVDPSSFVSTVMDKLRLRNLPGGSHTVKVVDSEGCEKNIELNLKESDPIEISAAASPVCPGEEFARVYVESVTGGTAPYLFALDDSTDFNDNQFKKVLSGTTHSIAVKDANGCVNKSELIPPSTKGLAIDSIDCVVTNWHSIDDVVVFIDITNTKDIDSVSFSIKAEDLPQGVSYEIIDPDYFRYGLMPGDTVEWKNGKTYYGPLWSIPDEIVSCVLSEAEYDKEYDRLGGLIDSLEVLIKNTSDTSLRNGYQMLLTSQEERLNSICTKDEVLEVFTTELLQDSSIERMQFIRLLTDSVIESSDSVLFSYAFTQTLYVEGCDLTIEYNGLNGKNPNHVENGDQHYASLTTKDILDLIAAPNPTIPGDECTIAVTLKSKKDVYCDVYGLNGGVSSTNELSIKADSYDWEQSDSNFICKFKVKFSETAIVRVRTATDAASVVVLVNPSER